MKLKIRNVEKDTQSEPELCLWLEQGSDGQVYLKSNYSRHYADISSIEFVIYPNNTWGKSKNGNLSDYGDE